MKWKFVKKKYGDENVINILKAFCIDEMVFGAFISTQMKQSCA